MILTADMESTQTNGFTFSAIRPETLGATEYTLVTLVVDKTYSVKHLSQSLLHLKRTVLGACRKSARADFLLIRLVEFNTSVDEVHGFRPLSGLQDSDYVEADCRGSTALYDATYSAIAATTAYAKTLTDQDYLVNGIVFVLTDGDDNCSHMTTTEIQKAIEDSQRGEKLESLRTVLVGVNTDNYFRTKLEQFKQEVGIDQYVDVTDATTQKLAKLAAFVSQSISAQSQALGTGGPSQTLVF